MKHVLLFTYMAAANAAPANAEMPLWNYFDRFWGALEKTCGFAIRNPQGFVDGSSAHAFADMPLWMRTIDNSVVAVFQEVDGMRFIVSFDSLPSVRQTTCETGEPDEETLRIFSGFDPAEAGRQLIAWMEARQGFEFSGGQLLIQEDPNATPIGDQEHDYVLSSTIGGQNVVYTIGIYGVGLDLYLTHEVRP